MTRRIVKIWTVERCCECPAFYTKSSYQYCDLENRNIEDENIFPDWCPLGDM